MHKNNHIYVKGFVKIKLVSLQLKRCLWAMLVLMVVLADTSYNTLPASVSWEVLKSSEWLVGYRGQLSPQRPEFIQMLLPLELFGSLWQRRDAKHIFLSFFKNTLWKYIHSILEVFFFKFWACFLVSLTMIILLGDICCSFPLIPYLTKEKQRNSMPVCHFSL